MKARLPLYALACLALLCITSSSNSSRLENSYTGALLRVQPEATRIAVIGDFGDHGFVEPNGRRPTKDVADLVASWEQERRLDTVITLGDNNYVCGNVADMDKNIGQYYKAFINFDSSYTGPLQGAQNRTLPDDERGRRPTRSAS